MKTDKIKYHPMLFSTPMVQAILEGRKTKTRRTKGLESINENPNNWELWRFYDGFAKFAEKHNSINEKFIKCPYNIDDVLWVQEPWRHSDDLNDPFDYKAGFELEYNQEYLDFIKNSWQDSTDMYKEACRIFLKIKSIRVERLQEISEEDAIAEGSKDRLKHSDLKVLEGLKDWIVPSPFLQHQFGFLAIWCTLKGCDNWIKNPFVWVYEFEEIEKPLDFI